MTAVRNKGPGATAAFESRKRERALSSAIQEAEAKRLKATKGVVNIFLVCKVAHMYIDGNVPRPPGFDDSDEDITMEVLEQLGQTVSA